MTRRTTSTIEIAAPVDAVYRVIVDVAHYPAWIKQLRSAEVLTTDAEGRPAHVRFVIDAGIFSDDLVMSYSWHADGGDWELVTGTKVRQQSGSYRLTATDAGTHVEYDLALDVDMPMFGFLRPQAERMIVDAALTSLGQRVTETSN